MVRIKRHPSRTPEVRVALYARSAAVDVETQLGVLRAYVAKRRTQGDNWVIASTFTDGGRASPRRRAPPGIARLLAMVAARGIEVVVVPRVTTLSRSISALFGFLGRLKRHGVGLVAAGDGLDFTTPTGRVVADFYMDLIAHERARRSKRRGA